MSDPRLCEGRPHFIEEAATTDIDLMDAFAAIAHAVADEVDKAVCGFYKQVARGEALDVRAHDPDSGLTIRVRERQRCDRCGGAVRPEGAHEVCDSCGHKTHCCHGEMAHPP